jgi:prepilin-type N-terminal cleavage/methylation domain-containing protein
MRERGGGFTLLEVLLTLAIIGLLAGTLIGGSARLLRQQPATPHEVFTKAVQEARKAALKAGHETRLRFDKQKREFLVLDGIAPSGLAADGFTVEEKPLKRFPVPDTGDRDLAIDFLPPPSRNSGTILVGGVLLETQTLKFVTFFPDGTCTPFRAQFYRNGASSTPLAIDPWTCAPMLPPADPNARPFL